MALNVFLANGNLGKEPEIKVSQSGSSITRFSLAVKGNRKDENGEYKTNWLNCLAFGKTAELIANHCKKGDKIGIRGSIETGSYQAQDGSTKYTTDVIVQEIEFLTSKQQGQAQQPTQQQYQQQQPQFAPQQQVHQQAPQGYTQQQNFGSMAPQYGQAPQQQQVIDESNLPF